MTLPMSWRKSSASANGQNCVEIRADLNAVRDSKNPVAVLPVPREAITTLVRSIR